MLRLDGELADNLLAISRRERLPQSELVRIACRAFYGIAEPRQSLAAALANADAPWLNGGAEHG
jgi:hypothetical protein